MLENIRIKSEDGKIKVLWEWSEDEVTSVDIRYKKSEIESGDGTEFMQGGVSRHPGVKTGNAERRLMGEFGLYTFTFVMHFKNNPQDEKMSIPNVALGKPFKIYWRIENTKNGMMLSFLSEQANQATLKAGSISMLYEQYRYIFRQEISDTAKLVFPGDIRAEAVTLRAVEPYDQIYQLIRQRD